MPEVRTRYPGPAWKGRRARRGITEETLSMENTLYYGDNLDILKRYIKDESIDLVYLDPPFKSSQNYNILFKEKNGSQAASQIRAFEDTWRWDRTAAEAYQKTVEAGGRVSHVMQAFRLFLGDSDMLAYLSMMAPRLVELRRIMKLTGSLYLHCDPTASHYLKILLDAVFGPMNFVNEVIWKRTTAHNDPTRWGRIHDIILFFSKTTNFTWNSIHLPHSEEYKTRFRNIDPDGRRWADDNLTAKGLSGGGYTYEYKGVTSLWRVPLDSMKLLDAAGRLHFTKRGGIRLKRYLEDTAGTVIQDVIADISPINSQAQERLGYPTQKPETLLERIIQASSNEGDIVLDPFCGCGTTIAAAQKLNRRWIGIDITQLAIALIKHRLFSGFGERELRDGEMRAPVQFTVIGEPVSLPDAKTLAESDPNQFQWWALGQVGARPVEQKKGADKGIDGRLYFHDEPGSGKTKQVILSVKAGHTSVADVRDLRGVTDREKAEIGVLITMQEPTGPMRTEVAGGGFYHSPGWNRDYPRLQILTIAELLAGKKIEMPPIRQVDATFKKATKFKGKKPEQLEIKEPK
jgi:DNA modification methylase